MNKPFNVTSDDKTIIKLFEKGDHKSALQLALTAVNVKTNAKSINLHHIIASCYIIEKDFENAEIYAEKVIALGGVRADYLENHAYCLMMLDNVPKLLLKYSNQNLLIKSDKLFLIVFEAVEKAGCVDRMQETAEKLLETKSTLTDQALCLCADILSKGEKPETAIPYFKSLLAHNPDNVNFYHKLAQLYKITGDKTEAIKLYKAIVKKFPDNTEAHRLLTVMGCFEISNEALSCLADCFENPTSVNMKVHAGFALGQRFEKQEDFRSAFYFFKEANNIEFNNREYNHLIDALHINNIYSAFETISEKKINKRSFKFQKTPILIVGMPRSGSTLLEQILSSHSQIYGAGETNALPKSLAGLPMKKTFEKQDELDKLCYFGCERYNERLQNLPTKNSFVVDKMLSNYYYLGFVLNACPDVKVINMKRDFMAVAWSIFKRYLPYHDYSFSLDAIYIAYKRYLDLMSFWKERFPSKIIDLDYDKLVSSQEAETRKLLEFLNLTFEEKCLSFHLNKRAVKTASSEQVRKKMYTGSSDVWRNYEINLAPYPELFKALEREYYPIT